MVILGFVVKGRPWAYLQPEVPGLSVVVHNMAKERILIKSFKCQPVSLFVGRSHEARYIVDAQAGVPLNSVIAPESKHSFSLLTNREWDEVAPDRKVVIALRWSTTRTRWLPQSSIRIRTTVGFVKAVMRFMRNQDDIPFRQRLTGNGLNPT
jgi:hypothetical protein